MKRAPNPVAMRITALICIFLFTLQPSRTASQDYTAVSTGVDGVRLTLQVPSSETEYPRDDLIQALLLAPDGSQGWAVGGETGIAMNASTPGALLSSGPNETYLHTAGIYRYPAASTPPGPCYRGTPR